MRSEALRSHAALGLWWDEFRKAESKSEPRAGLVALNTVLKKHGVQHAAFGPPEGIPVGLVCSHCTELQVTGLHRHFLRELSFTIQGAESLVVHASGASERCEDNGASLWYGGSGFNEQQVQESLSALQAAAKPAPRHAGGGA